MRQITRGIAVGILSLAMAVAAFGQTEVGGGEPITGHQTWTTAGSPYLVVGDVTVADTLTIEPGVSVEFQGPYAFNVQGVLISRGSIPETDPDVRVEPDQVSWVVFTQDTTGLPMDQRWRGIRFDNASSGSVIQWTVIENGYARGDWPLNNGGGLFVRATSPRIENVVLRGNRAENFGGGAYLVSTASTFRNNLITNNYAGISGGGLYIDLSAIHLYNLTVVRNIAGPSDGALYHGNGIFFGPGINPYIRSSILFKNQHTSTDDEGYFNAGRNTSNDPEIRNSIDTSFPENNPALQVLADTSEAGFREYAFYTLADSSGGVDGGVIDDDRWVNEPTPNGGPNGGRINMGAWGGTKLGNKSLPVAVAVNNRNTRSGRVAFTVTRPGETNSATAIMKNIGAGLLTLSHDSLRWNPQRETNNRFEIRPFPDQSVRPDSNGTFEILYHAQAGDTITDTLEVGTNGGKVIYSIRAIAINPLIQVDTTGIDFGIVDIDNPAQYSLDVSNVGSTDLGISFSFRTGNFDGNVTNQPTTVPPGETITYVIECAPNVTGELIDVMRIGNNDRPVSIDLHAYARGAIPEVLSPESDTLDFAYLNAGDTRDKTVLFRNNGNDPLVIDSTWTSSSVFSTNVGSGGISIDSAGTGEVVVTFQPNGLETYSDSLMIYAGPHSWKYYLLGRGTEGGHYFSGIIPDPANGIPSVWGEGDDSVYVCAGPTILPAGETITIRPGVTVYYEGGDFIQVEGKLEVLGEPGDSVYFKPLLGQYHGGLRLLASQQGTRLEYAVIDSGRTWSVADINTYYDLSEEDRLRAGQPHFLAHGGGLSIYNCNPVIRHIAVRNSYSDQDGGGIWIYQAAPTMLDVTVEHNEAVNRGGGVFLWGSAPEFHGSTIRENTSGSNGGGLGFYSYSNALFTNNVVTDNVSHGWGGAIFVSDHSAPQLLNDVLYNNVDDSTANGISANGASRPIFRNSVLWGTGGEAADIATGSELIAYYSFIQGGYPGGVSIYDQDPMLNSANGYRPMSGSPVIDAGDPDPAFEDFSFPPSQGEVRNDVGITGGPFAASIGGAVMQLAVFRNPATPRGLHFMVTAQSAISEDVPTVSVTSYLGTEALDVNVVDAANNIWRASYEASESIFLEIAASGTIDGNTVATRRRASITLFKTAAGGQMTFGNGAQLVLPPHAISRDVMLLGNMEIASSLPEAAAFASPVGQQYVIDAPVNNWSEEGELILPYDSQTVPSGRERGLSVWRLNEDGWQQMESYVEPETRTIRASVKGSGSFQVLYQTTGDVSTLLPTRSALGSNYPNPFNPSTTIPFELNGAAEVSVSVFNVIGQKVATVAKGWYTAGSHAAVWDGRDFSGRPVASGLYLYRMETHPANGATGLTQTRKLILMR